MGSLLQAAYAAAVGALLLVSTAGAQAAGALAVGSCAAYGVAYDFRSRLLRASRLFASARAVAKSSRRSGGAAPLTRSTGAISAGAHGFAAAPTLGRAQNIALKYCYQHGGKDCMVRAWACDGKG